MRNTIRSTTVAVSSLTALLTLYLIPSHAVSLSDLFIVTDDFSTKKTSSEIIKTLNKDFSTFPGIEDIFPISALFDANTPVVLKGNHHNLTLTQLKKGIDGNFTKITFKDFDKVICSNSNVSENLLVCKDLTFTNNKCFCFCNIHSLEGVNANLNTQTSLTIKDNDQVVLYGNASEKSGSVGQGGFLCISGNNTVVSRENVSGYGGTFHYDNISITNNNSLVFSNNKSTGVYSDTPKSPPPTDTLMPYGGGGISASTSVDITNNQSVEFDNNTSQSNGGAIYCKNATISDNGSVIFNHNTGVTNGGAIFVDSGGVCTISANKGDVVFQNNYTGSNVRNSIATDKNVTLQLQAEDKHQIFLGDPVVTGITSYETSTVNFNTRNPFSTHQGKIVFIYTGDDTSTGGGISKLDSTVTQDDGVVYVGKNADLSMLNFSQTGGWLVIGSGGTVSTLETTNASNGKKNTQTSTLTITNLGVDVASILDEAAATPSTKESSPATPTPKLLARANGAERQATKLNGTITVSGPVCLNDGDMLLYENDSRMGSPINNLSLLQLGDTNGAGGPEAAAAAAAGTNGNIDASNLNLTQQPFHYGYQGSWALSWDKNTLKGSWMPNGEYLISPERKGFIIANSLWGNFAGVTSFLDSLNNNNFTSNNYPCQYTNWHHSASFAAITNLFKPHPTTFKYKSVGGAAKISSQSPQDVCCGVAVAKIRGNTVDENFYQKSKNELLCGAAFLEIHPWWHRFISSITASAVYGHDKERLDIIFKHTLPTKEPGYAEYHIHSLAGRFAIYSASIGRLPFPGTQVFPDIMPFLSVSAVGSKIAGFHEEGSKPRGFTSLHNFVNVTIPVGLKLNKEYGSKSHSSIWNALFSFSPDVFRRNPSVQGKLLFNDAEWECKGEDLSWVGFSIDCSTQYKIKSWQLNAQYTLHGRHSSMHHTANAGIQKIF